MLLSNAAIKNRTTILVLIVLIVFAGAYSYITLPRESAPDVPIPRIVIMTFHPGVSPEDIEKTITKKIEKELAGLKGMKEIRSISALGQSIIEAEFESDVDIDNALQRVKDKVDIAKAELPTAKERSEPVVQEINVSEFPIMLVGLSGTVSPVRLKDIAERLQDEIETIPGVLEAEILGALEREIRVELDMDRVAAYGLTAQELLAVIPSQHITRSAGGLETEGTKFAVRVPAEMEEPEEFFRIPLTTRNGRVIRLSDVATVADTFKDRDTISRLDGKPSITVAVKKRVGANIVDIADNVKAILAEAEKQFPAGVDITLTSDRSDEIRDMVKDLENNILTGLILVLVVLFLFMGLRPSLIVAMAIPLSMLISFSVLQLLGITLNMVVLFSLILALGMLVDNAIVIVENIYRHRSHGLGKIEAAMRGTSEVAWPVITSTATTVAAFSPMLFWPGIMGDFMKYLPMTVIVVLCSSLFVAMMISPVIASIISGKPAEGASHENRFVRGYRRLLGVALRHRVATLCLSVLLLLTVGLIYGRWGAGVELFPDSDPSQSVINLRCPQGTNIHKTDELCAIVEEEVEQFRTDPNTGQTWIDHVLVNVGSGGYDFFSSVGGTHTGNVTLKFPAYEERITQSAQITDWIRTRLQEKGIVGADVKVEKLDEGPPTGDPVSVRIIGRDLETLERLSKRVKELVRTTPNLINLRSDLEAAKPELTLDVERERASMLGLDTAGVAEFLQTAVLGREVGEFRDYNDEYDITIRLPVTQRSSLEDLFRYRLLSYSGRPVHVLSVGEFNYKPGLGTIHRIDQDRVVTVSGDNSGRASNEVLADVQDRLDPLGPTRILADDVAGWKTLVAFMRGEQTGPAAGAGRALWDRLGFLEKMRFPEAASHDQLTRKERSTVLTQLNAGLGERYLFDDAAIEGLELPDQARKLLAGGRDELDDRQVRRLNRLVLEAALPHAIVARERLELPRGYAIEYAGEKEEQEKAMSFLMRAFVIALLAIVCILVTQFNTLSAPVIIMTTVVLSMIGVLLGLLVFDMPFGIIMTGVGVISLAGVVVNNAIVLLDYTRQLQKRGMELIEAAVQAGATRLRPVLLTATTTILGLVPMMTGVSVNFRELSISTQSESGQWWKSMAVAVVFGLAFATVLTLVVVPSLYVMLYRLAEKLGLGGLKRAGADVEKPEVQLEDY